MKELLGTVLGKVLATGVSVLIALCLLLLYFNKSKDVEITQLTSKVSELSNRNSVLESQVENCKKQFEATIAAQQIQSNEVRTLNELQTTAVKELKELNKGLDNENKNITNSTRIPLDVVRVLTETCNKVRRETCPRP